MIFKILIFGTGSRGTIVNSARLNNMPVVGSIGTVVGIAFARFDLARCPAISGWAVTAEVS